MRLRQLIIDDAPFMLEWMHDPGVVKNMRTDFANKTIEDCKSFIEYANHTISDLHMAIVNDEDEYMGTVSLKHLNAKSAEFGITVRACAMGKGFSQYGMKQIIEKGFKELGLKEIYWCVSPLNQRALKFYDKQGFKRCEPYKVDYYSLRERETFVWYCVKEHNYLCV